MYFVIILNLYGLNIRCKNIWGGIYFFDYPILVKYDDLNDVFGLQDGLIRKEATGCPTKYNR